MSETAVIQSSEIVAGGRRLEIHRIGSVRTDEPTLVFLHEGLGSAASWLEFPAQLSVQTGCPALSYSRYGNGFSETLHEARAVDYMHVEALSALPEVLDELGVEEAILVGHSDGASVALINACNNRRVRGIILEAPHVFVEDLSIRSIEQIRDAYIKTGLREKLARYHADVDTTFYGWNDIWLDPAFRSWNIEAYASGVRCPILLVQGESDAYGTPAQLDAIRRMASGNTTVDELMLARCGHAPHRDRPSTVMAAMANFIEGALKNAGS